MVTALLTSQPRRTALPFTARLTPLAAALALVWQPLLHAAPPAPNKVPVPSANWRVNGTGGAAPVNTPNAHGGIKQTIDQASQRSIYNWDSFDIGANSEVQFNMAQKGSSALNRVTGSNAPSQIFGKLSATNKGEIFLINQNGILFGQGSQVNTGSLIASSLNITDSSFLSGFADGLSAISPKDFPAFRYDGDAANFIDSKNFVRVDQGATITTDNGGRVFLFAKRVDNAGSIQAPGGQVVLAAGGSVYLKLPTSEEKLYASETNPNVSAVRGFLVEVGNGPADAPAGSTGTASNLATGVVSTPRGNTTLVGMAVNQMGRISATTSVSENGSVILRAQGNASEKSVGESVQMRADESGAVVIGPGSRIEITPDSATATSSDSAGFATSHIDIAGQSVDFQRGASIVAPGASVNVRAETLPSYEAGLTASGGVLAAGDPNARIVLGEDVAIDVSGTTTAMRSVADLFVTTELLGSNDLKDAPIQKDGLLYRGRVTVDTRQDSAILGSLAGYRSNIQRGVTERLSRGGTVNLRAEGAVLTHEKSSIRVSGGRVGYTAATVNQTQLVAENGALYDINSAPADLVYVSAINFDKPGAVQYDRWGRVIDHGTVSSRAEAGYVEGRSAGSVTIAAPIVLLQGELKAGTTVGPRQAAGLDRAAHGGRLTIGATFNGQQDFAETAGSNPTPDAVLGHFTVSANGPVVGSDVWTAPTSATLSDASGMSMSNLAGAGFADITVVANGQVDFQHASTQPFQLADGGSLRLWSGYGDVHLGQSLRGAGATVELLSRDKVSTVDDQGTVIAKRSGSVVVDDGVTVDLSGQWVNQWLAGSPLTTAYTGGGRFSASGFGVSLGEDSLIDVSGGASMSLKGTFSGAAAGSITLADFSHQAEAEHTTLLLGGTLRGDSAQSNNGVTTGAGSLTLKTARVVISDKPEDARADALNLGSQFFSQGGFGSFTIDGRLSLEVAANTVIAPTQRVRQAAVDARNVASADTAAGALVDGVAPGLRRAGVNFRLSASGEGLDDPFGTTGVLTLGSGSALKAGPQATVSLSASHRLMDLGTIEAHGGQVTLSVDARSDTESNYLWLGAGSRIDVSGTTLVTPDTTDGLVHGSVLAGGSINLQAGSEDTKLVSLVLQKGSVLDASGDSGWLDLTERSATGVRTSRQIVSSQGGNVALSGNADLWLEGELSLRGGSASMPGGSLTVSQLAGRRSGASAGPFDDRELTLVRARRNATTTLTPEELALSTALNGDVILSTDWIDAAGASDLTLVTPGVLHFSQDTELHVDRNLRLATRALSAEAGTSSHLSAANVWWGATDAEMQHGSEPLQSVAASEGSASIGLSATSGLVLDGDLVTQGIGQLDLASAGDIRLQARQSVSGTVYVGSLGTLADVHMTAQQIYPSTDTRFTIDASGRTVSFSGGDRSVAKPMSANGTLEVKAAVIEQDGVLRAPMGHIALRASERLTLGAGSETSVSADGLTVLYGSVNSTSGTWQSPISGAAPLTSPPGKQVELEGSTDTASVITEEGSVVDVRGGGDLLATEFVQGKGGSTNIFAGGDGSYAIVPTVKGLGPQDQTDATTRAGLGKQIVISTAVKLGDGSTLPPGTYTLLPARHAMLDGAFLLRPVSATSSMSDGTTVARTDGSVNLAARLADAGTSFVGAQAGTWQVMSKGIAQRYSEIRTATASKFFAEKAARQGTAAPQLPRDGGSLVIRAQQVDLRGVGLFAGGRDAQGQTGAAGSLEIDAAAIEVDATTPVAGNDKVLHLSAAQLNQYGGGTVILGGSTAGAADGGTLLNVRASSVVFDQGAEALTLAGLVAVSTGEITVRDGAVFTPGAHTGSAAPVNYVIEGDGAAVRIDAAAGAGLTRTGTTGSSTAALNIGEHAAFNAAQGSLVLDSSGGSHIARSTTLRATDALISGNAMVIGARGDIDDKLVLTPAQLASLGRADHLTLRAYQRMSFADGALLGTAALDALVLDTPVLDVNPVSGTAQVTAGSVTLTNTTDNAPGVLPGGTGTLSINATTAEGGSGELRLGAGHIAIAGASQLSLTGDRGISLFGKGQLVASNNVSMQAPAITAGESAASHEIKAAGQVRIVGTGATPELELFDGGTFSVAAQTVDMSGRIVMPSGQVTLQGDQGVHLSAGARLNTAGRSIQLDNQAVELAGGQVTVGSATGNVALDAGSYVDVSGAGKSGHGGTLNLEAAQGEVRVDGALVGRSGESGVGASLNIDAGHDLRVAQLGLKIGEGQFSDQLHLRQREGDMTVASGVTLKSRDLAIQVDGGQLTVAGTLDASGTQAGRVVLSARDDLDIGQGARLLAGTDTAGANGGAVALSSSQGWVRLAPRSLVDVRAGATTDTASPEGGRVELRALQQGGNVAIGALNGDIVGASRIDVQAVKVYENISTVGNHTDGTTIGRARIEANATQFIGAGGENAERIAERLLAGHAELSDQLKIHAEAEVRSNGDLALKPSYTDWVLPTHSLSTGAAHVGDMSLTLRAAGALNLEAGVSSGLGVDPWGGLHGAAASDHGGAVRLIAGADLMASRVETIGKTAHKLTLSPLRADVMSSTYSYTGSSTGDVTLMASGDIDIAKWGTFVQTTGRRLDQATFDAVEEVSNEMGGVQETMAMGGRGAGTTRLEAGGSIRSGSWQAWGAGYDGVDQWNLVRENTAASLGWGTTLGLLGRGIVSVGGGAIDVRAGQDILNLVAIAPGSGYRLEATADRPQAIEQHFTGGSVRVQAGRDIVDGMYEAGGALLDLQAGRDVAARAGNPYAQPGTRVYYENGAVHVDARRDVTLSTLTSRYNIARLQGLDGQASATVQATAGNLLLNEKAIFAMDDIELLPDHTRLAAAHGDVTIESALLQQPQSDGELVVLAGGNLTVADTVTVNATQTSQREGARRLSEIEAFTEQAGVLTDGPDLLDQSGRSPVQFAAGSGDLLLSYQNTTKSARPLRLVAGHDVYIGGATRAQHQPDADTGAWGEQTVVKAGNDIVLRDPTVPASPTATLQVAGPGEVVLLAGRDIDLGSAFTSGASGVMGVGNTANGLLPQQSASLTLVAGLRADGVDYTQAIARGFAVIGHSAMTNRAGDLFALLSATDAASVKLDSAEAKAFDAKSTNDQLAAVKTLMGQAAYDQALAGYVRSLPGNSQLSDSAALAQFAKMTPARQDAAPGSLLTAHFATLSADTRHGFVAQVAAADAPRHAQALQAWMKQTTGRQLALDQAIVAFEALPIERQIGWLNQMLVEEVRNAGRSAAVSSGVDKEAAYLRGYLAIDSIFPGQRPEGDIRMPSTQAKTLQQAGFELVAESQTGTRTDRAIDLNGITMLTPGGSVNAGEVGASEQSPNNLGVVTVAGGDIAAITKEDFLVNQSRVFSLDRGDILLWSSEGDIDAGRGAKTVSGAPAPVLRLDPKTGQLYLDTSGSFTGSGIAVLNEDSDLDLYAPSGAIDAGEAGIRARGNVFLGAVVVRGADNIQIGGNAAGSPIGAVPVTLPAAVAPVPSEARGGGDDEDERRKRLRARRQLLLDFLGYGRG